MKFFDKYLLIFMIVLLFSCTKKTNNENNIIGIDEVIENNNEIFLSELDEYTTIYYDLDAQTDPRILKKSKKITGNGIVIEFMKPEFPDYILWCEVFHDVKYIQYYYQIILRMDAKYNNISGTIDIFSPDHDELTERISQKNTKFSYEIFLNDIKLYLLEKKEDENNIDTIMYILSLEKENTLSKINSLNINMTQ
jgi:hypothetical protein